MFYDQNEIKIEIFRKTYLKNPKPNGTILNLRVKEEIKRDIGKYFELKENENTIYQNLWNTTEAELRGKSIASNA